MIKAVVTFTKDGIKLPLDLEASIEVSDISALPHLCRMCSDLLRQAASEVTDELREIAANPPPVEFRLSELAPSAN